MKKKLISMMAMACLVLSLTACGGNGETAQKTEPETTEQAEGEESTESAETADTSDGMTLEDYFNSAAMQAFIETAKAQYLEEGIESEMYAEGNELRYDFTMSDIETTDEDRSLMSDVLASMTEASADSFIDTAKQAKEVVTNDEVIVVITYYDGAGNELYSQSFSSADAE